MVTLMVSLCNLDWKQNLAINNREAKNMSGIQHNKINKYGNTQLYD